MAYSHRLCCSNLLDLTWLITCTGSTDPVEHFKANLLALREQLVKAKKEVEKVTKERDEVRDLLAAPVLTVYMCVI